MNGGDDRGRGTGGGGGSTYYDTSNAAVYVPTIQSSNLPYSNSSRGYLKISANTGTTRDFKVENDTLSSVSRFIASPLSNLRRLETSAPIQTVVLEWNSDQSVPSTTVYYKDIQLGTIAATTYSQTLELDRYRPPPLYFEYSQLSGV